jgi:hypothetical protein
MKRTLDGPTGSLAEWALIAGQHPIANRPDNLHRCRLLHFRCVNYLDAEVVDARGREKVMD